MAYFGRKRYRRRPYYGGRKRRYYGRRNNMRLGYNPYAAVIGGDGAVSLPYARGGAASKAAFGETYRDASDLQKLRRVAFGFRGKGDYKRYLRYIPRGLGALAGGALGYMKGGVEGGASGAMSGWKKGGNFSKFLGWGDLS